jgi:hypothetical protein
VSTSGVAPYQIRRQTGYAVIDRHNLRVGVAALG